MLEVFKSLKFDNPLLIKEMFHLKCQPYNLRNKLLLKIPEANSITYGTNSILFKASIILNSLSNEYKMAKSISEFKNGIKLWKGVSCSCFICT